MLSMRIKQGMKIRKSEKSFRNERSCLQLRRSVMYSASVLEVETASCFKDGQDLVD